MSSYFLIAFLILFGLAGLGVTLLPVWVGAGCALIAGILMLVGK